MKCATLWPDPIFVQIPLHCRCTCLRVEEIKTNNKDFKRWNLRKRSRCWSRRWGNKIAPSRCSSPGDKSCRLLWKVAKYLSNYYTSSAIRRYFFRFKLLQSQRRPPWWQTTLTSCRPSTPSLPLIAASIAVVLQFLKNIQLIIVVL